MEKRRLQVEKLEEKNAAHNAKRAEESSQMDTSSAAITESTFSYKIEKISDGKRVYPMETKSSTHTLNDIHAELKRASSLIHVTQTPMQSPRGSHPEHIGKELENEANSDTIVINCASHAIKTPRGEISSPRKQPMSPNMKTPSKPSSPKPQHTNDQDKTGNLERDYSFGCNEFSGIDVIDKDHDVESQSHVGGSSGTGGQD